VAPGGSEARLVAWDLGATRVYARLRLWTKHQSGGAWAARPLAGPTGRALAEALASYRYKLNSPLGGT